jgi:hypothetical protein
MNIFKKQKALAKHILQIAVPFPAVLAQSVPDYRLILEQEEFLVYILKSAMK